MPQADSFFFYFLGSSLSTKATTHQNTVVGSMKHQKTKTKKVQAKKKTTKIETLDTSRDVTRAGRGQGSHLNFSLSAPSIPATGWFSPLSSFLDSPRGLAGIPEHMKFFLKKFKI